jgi:hypothetical protein
VDEPNHHLLARASFPKNKDGQIGLSDKIHHAAHFAHGFAVVCKE